MKILVLNGPSLNLLGLREPEIYGSKTYKDLVGVIEAHCLSKDIEAEIRQTNHEGTLVDYIHQALFDKTDAIVINPAAYTHTSIALLDALRAASLPAVEVHLSDTGKREDFRKKSYVREACLTTIQGKGFEGYLEAIDFLALYLANKP